MPFSIQINNLSKQFGKITALNKLSAQIPASSVVSIVGPDSAGKTTLMRLLAGLMRPSSGIIKIFGKDRMEIKNLDNSIAYMPQKFGLYEDLSVFDNLNLHAELKHIPLQERQQNFEKLLQFTSLAPFCSRLAGRLSGGMKQKLGLACALLGSPKLLLLDEPGVGVDPVSRRELWNMVQELTIDGMSVLWATAYMDEAAKSSHILMLSEGKLLYNGKPSDWIDSLSNRVFFDIPPHNAPNMWAKESLIKWTADKKTLDALVQGSKVRILFSKEAEIPQNLTPTKANLEDAYMDIVGGIDKNPSTYHTLADKSIVSQSDNTSSLPIIEAQGLFQQFGDFVAAQDISFTVSKGKIFGLLGPNGAGKSTTFKMLCGLLKPSAGKCFIHGLNVYENLEKVHSLLGYMAQKFSLYEDLTVWQNICFIARLYNIEPDIFQKRSVDLIKNLNLEKYKHISTSLLSLGQKQRLSLLCATLHAPQILFLDEPTSGVDPRARRDFWKHIHALTLEGVAVIVTTHFMEEAEYCDEIVLISHGKIIAQGCPDEIKQSQKNSKNTDPSLEDAFIAYLEQEKREIIEQTKANSSFKDCNFIPSNEYSKLNKTAIQVHNMDSVLKVKHEVNCTSKVTQTGESNKNNSNNNKNNNNNNHHSDFIRWWRVVIALIYKESKQIMRDPSSYIVAFVLPFIFLMFFGFAISLDTGMIRLAIFAKSQGKYTQSLILDINQSSHFKIQMIYDRKQGENLLLEQKVHGIFIIPEDFDKKIELNQGIKTQLIIDATEPNNAKQVEFYTGNILEKWTARRQEEQGVKVQIPIIGQVNIWYNNTANSRWALIPGSITVIMTTIGTLLTSLVITREWERGSMEVLFASPISRMQIFISKFIPYYMLAMVSMGLCTLAGIYIFGVPYRGSIFALFLLSTAFLFPALGQGLLISSSFKSQFPAAMLGFITGLLPALILSGLIFDIQSMPTVVQYITLLIPARYFLLALQTAFLSGDIWSIYLPAIMYMFILGMAFLYKAYSNLTKNLDE